MSLLSLHTRSLEIATDFVDAVGPDDLARPADPDGHDVGDLLALMCQHNHAAANTLRGASEPFTARRGQHAEQWRETSSALHAAATALHPDLAASRLGAHLLDTVVHTRVLATALGLDWRPTPATIDAVRDVARNLPGGELRLVTSGLLVDQ